MSETARRPPDEHEAAWRRNFWIILTLFGFSVLALLLLLATLGILWNSLHTSRETTHLARSAPPAAPPAPEPLPVAVVPARATRATATITLPGHPRAGVDWYVAAPASGRVARVLAAPGTRVVAGQVVARIATAVRRGPAGRRAGGAPTHSPGRLARPERPPRRRWVTRPPSAAAVAAREEGIRAAARRMARAERALRGTESELTEAREARARAQPARDVARQDAAEAEALVTRARAEVASQDAAVRQVEMLFRAGAASHSEVNENRSARTVAGDRLGRAQARAQAARSAAAAAEAGLARAEAAVNTAEERLRQARAEVAAAREGARSAERMPVPRRETVLEPAVETAGGRRPPGSAGWTVVSTFADVRAPASGTVSTLLAGPGAYVSRGQALVRLTRPSGRRYRVEGPADQLRGVRPGAPARLRVAGRTPIPARVSAVFPLGPSPSGGGAGGRGPRRRVAVEVTASVAPGIAPGSGVSVELTVLGPATAVAVPARAIRHTPAGPTVWIAQPAGKEGAGTAWAAHRRVVRVGARRDGQVEIRAGLAPDSHVIVAGMEKLRDGQSVAAVPWSLP